MADNESLSSIMAKLKKKREAIESNNVSAPKAADGEKETVEEIINSETAPAEEAAEANTEAAEAPEKANEENASESAVQTDTVDTADMFESSSAQSDAAPAVEENSNSGE
ncbi:MAG: hypothetical protein MJ137_09310, partial [Clostridia bacterium]|nr:hypothetical protein [Clostridia bacterium]